jgi:hypothetical protein
LRVYYAGEPSRMPPAQTAVYNYGRMPLVQLEQTYLIAAVCKAVMPFALTASTSPFDTRLVTSSK